MASRTAFQSHTYAGSSARALANGAALLNELDTWRPSVRAIEAEIAPIIAKLNKVSVAMVGVAMVSIAGDRRAQRGAWRRDVLGGCNPVHPGCNPASPSCNLMHPGVRRCDDRARARGAVGRPLRTRRPDGTHRSQPRVQETVRGQALRVMALSSP